TERKPIRHGECSMSRVLRGVGQTPSLTVGFLPGSLTDAAYCGLAGTITRSARTGPSSVTAVKRNGRCRVSSPTHIRICSLSACRSSVVSDNGIAEMFWPRSEEDTSELQSRVG